MLRWGNISKARSTFNKERNEKKIVAFLGNLDNQPTNISIN